METVTGFEHKVTSKYSHGNAIETGLFNRIELGYDNDWSGNTVYNAKVQLLNEKDTKGFGAFSVGAQNYKTSKGDWCWVGRHDGKGYRAHFGYLQSDEGHAMFGIDAPYRTETVSLEYFGGNGGRVSGAYTFNVKQIEGLSIMLVLSRPNDPANGWYHSAVFNYGFRY